MGKILRIGQSELQLIGVVADIRERGLAEPVDPTMYLHILQNFRSRMSIVARCSRAGSPRAARCESIP